MSSLKIRGRLACMSNVERKYKNRFFWLKYKWSFSIWLIKYKYISIIIKVFSSIWKNYQCFTLYHQYISLFYNIIVIAGCCGHSSVVHICSNTFDARCILCSSLNYFFLLLFLYYCYDNSDRHMVRNSIHTIYLRSR